MTTYSGRGAASATAAAAAVCCYMIIYIYICIIIIKRLASFLRKYDIFKKVDYLLRK